MSNQSSAATPISPRVVSPNKKGDIFFELLVKFATYLTLLILGGIILSFLVYLELYAYFTKPAEKTSKKEVQPKTALSKFKLGYEDIAAK